MKDLDNNTNNPTFKIVRDFIIKGLGLASLGWLSETFLKEGFGLGALRNKVSSGVSVKGSVSGLKVLDRKPAVVDDEGIEHRRIRYRVDLWVSQLKDELAYKVEVSTDHTGHTSKDKGFTGTLRGHCFHLHCTDRSKTIQAWCKRLSLQKRQVHF